MHILLLRSPLALYCGPVQIANARSTSAHSGPLRLFSSAEKLWLSES